MVERHVLHLVFELYARLEQWGGGGCRHVDVDVRVRLEERSKRISGGLSNQRGLTQITTCAQHGVHVAHGRREAANMARFGIGTQCLVHESSKHGRAGIYTWAQGDSTSGVESENQVAFGAQCRDAGQTWAKRVSTDLIRFTC